MLSLTRFFLDQDTEIMDRSIIRLATPADLPLIDQLANEVLSEHSLPRDSAVAALDSDYFSDGGEVNTGLARFWLAIIDSEVIGSAAIVPKSGSMCTFKTFYVKPAHRGKRIGYGLYINAESFARSAHYSSMQI
jgi:predicted N-acetyltransferase YhbS